MKTLKHGDRKALKRHNRDKNSSVSLENTGRQKQNTSEQEQAKYTNGLGQIRRFAA